AWRTSRRRGGFSSSPPCPPRAPRRCRRRRSFPGARTRGAAPACSTSASASAGELLQRRPPLSGLRQRSHRAPRLARLVRAGGPPAARASHLQLPQVRAPLLGPPASPPVVRAAGGGSRYEAARARGRLARDDALLAHAHLRPHRPRVGGAAGALLRAARVVAGGGDGRARGRLGQPVGVSRGATASPGRPERVAGGVRGGRSP